MKQKLIKNIIHDLAAIGVAGVFVFALSTIFVQSNTTVEKPIAVDEAVTRVDLNEESDNVQVNGDSQQEAPVNTILSRVVSDDESDSHEAISSDQEAKASEGEDNPTEVKELVQVEMPFTDEIDGESIVSENGTFPLRSYSTSDVPNDPYYNQWWVENQGLEAAWDIGSGTQQTTIAIIDTGFDIGHEEFVDRWHENGGETGATTSEASSDLNCSDQSLQLDFSCNNIDDDFDGILDNESGLTTVENPSRLNCSDQSLTLDKSCNLIDDDGNGFVDDLRGWDFAHFDQNVEAGEVDPAGSGNYHGTQVAGTAAATGNNGVGVAGIDWNAKILPVQVFDDYEVASSLTVARAIIYAADQDVDVINLSLGSVYPDEYVRYAVQYALDSGAVVVAASGNYGCDCITYPANYPEVVAVGATTWANERAYFSNWGTNLDLTAPGVGMSLPTWSAGGDDAYSSSSAGTSFSAPLVSGLLSLAKSHQPDASWDELVSNISSTGIRNPNTAKDYQLGFAITDAGKLLDRLTTARDFPQVYAVRSSETELYFCPGEAGSHTIHLMKQGEEVFYAINSYELFVLQQAGWVTTAELYVCTILPGDTVDSVKIIDPSREFEGQYSKPQ